MYESISKIGNFPWKNFGFLKILYKISPATPAPDPLRGEFVYYEAMTPPTAPAPNTDQKLATPNAAI